MKEYTLEDYYGEADVLPAPSWAKDIVLRDPANSSLLKPMWHQIEDLTFGFRFDNMRCGIFNEMGTGKTLSSQAFAVWHAASGNKVLVLMPTILIGQYLYNLRHTFVGVAERLSAEVYNGTPAQRDKIIDRWNATRTPDIVLTTYDMFMREHVVFSDYQVMVADECRVIGNTDSKTSIAIDRFMGNPGDKAAMLMNGTPGKNTLYDLFGYIQFLTPGVYVSKLGFESLHVERQSVSTTIRVRGNLQAKTRSLITGFKNLPLLNQNLYLQARRVEKAKVLDLPGKRLIPVRFELSKRHKAKYDKLVKEKLLIFPDDAMLDISLSASVRNTCMQLVIDPGMVQLDEESALFEALDEILEQLDLTKTKVFLLAHYQKTIVMLGNRYSKYCPALVYGGSNSEKEKDRFLQQQSCRMMIANYTSGGVGLNLQSVCHDVIAVEPTPVPGDFQQAVDRVDRKGQLHKVMVYMLIALGTIYAKTVKVMRKKEGEILEVVSKGMLQAELYGDVVQEEEEADESDVDTDMTEW